MQVKVKSESTTASVIVVYVIPNFPKVTHTYPFNRGNQYCLQYNIVNSDLYNGYFGLLFVDILGANLNLEIRSVRPNATKNKTKLLSK
jgi:hypothetical protein